jgi:hypothetical protein
VVFRAGDHVLSGRSCHRWAAPLERATDVPDSPAPSPDRGRDPDPDPNRDRHQNPGPERANDHASFAERTRPRTRTASPTRTTSGPRCRLSPETWPAAGSLDAGRGSGPLPDYSATTSYTFDWTLNGQSVPMRLWRRPLHAMPDAFTAAGVRLSALSEPGPDPAARELFPDGFRDFSTRPDFLFFVLEAARPAAGSAG